MASLDAHVASHSGIKENHILARYSAMIEACPAGRAGTPDESGLSLLMGPDGAFITGSDFLMVE
jgi:hypothetical protein